MSAKAYEIVSGFFIHDTPQADPATIEALPSSFGLLSTDSASAWSDFTTKITSLNAGADAGTSYKVLVLGRHGEGHHNVAERKYGTKAWDEHWSLLNGDDELVWGPDPRLTSLGEAQARSASAAWANEILRGMPLPQKFYCSPMTRALHTWELTFTGVLPEGHPTPIIVENCREEYGEHTCDKRRTRSEIQLDFPRFIFEDEFTEEDLLWTPERETKASAEVRARSVLDKIFENDVEDTIVSITAHGGIINALLRVIGRGNYTLPTGGVMSVVVKGVNL
ncbi:phosphoglycerate mutase-like protein [Dentipellis sp. KUC8613]|nr:phosphoglycerate mutase-like protein [Dentipellis sp. KUC8613]